MTTHVKVNTFQVKLNRKKSRKKKRWGLEVGIVNNLVKLEGCYLNPLKIKAQGVC